MSTPLVFTVEVVPHYHVHGTGPYHISNIDAGEYVSKVVADRICAMLNEAYSIGVMTGQTAQRVITSSPPLLETERT